MGIILEEHYLKELHTTIDGCHIYRDAEGWRVSRQEMSETLAFFSKAGTENFFN